MTYSLCIIDDGFLSPAQALSIERHPYFSTSTIDVLLKQNWGEEYALKELCTSLLTEEGGRKIWEIFAFSNPFLFKDAFDNQSVHSDTIIFDWEYTTQADFDHADFLKHVLSRCHSQICIFTGKDKEGEIKALIDQELPQFNTRITLLNKDNNGTPNTAAQSVKDLITEGKENNFGFKFGRELRRSTNQSLNNVLLNLSSMNIEHVLSQLSHDSENEVDNDIKELVGIKLKDKLKENKELQGLLNDKGIDGKAALELLEFVAEKAKNEIISLNISHEAAATQADNMSPEALQKLWSYRLYHHPHDGLVRTGDIIKINNAAPDKLYLVVTGPCDLNKFWKATAGILNLIELVDIDESQEQDDIKNKTELVTNINNASFKGSFRPTSLTNVRSLETISGIPIVVPYIPVNITELKTYLLFPKNITSDYIEMPDNIKALENKKDRQISLQYAHTSYERVCAVSDPFLAPLVGSIISRLFGWGVPDFPKAIQEHLITQVTKVFE